MGKRTYILEIDTADGELKDEAYRIERLLTEHLGYLFSDNVAFRLHDAAVFTFDSVYSDWKQSGGDEP